MDAVHAPSEKFPLPLAFETLSVRVTLVPGLTSPNDKDVGATKICG